MVQLVRGLDCLPEPTRQHEVVDVHGSFVARLDLSWPELGLFVELDGQHHEGQPCTTRAERRRSSPRPDGYRVASPGTRWFACRTQPRAGSSRSRRRLVAGREPRRQPILGLPPGQLTGRKRRLRATAGYPTSPERQAWNAMRVTPLASANGVWPPGPAALPRLGSTGVEYTRLHGPSGPSHLAAPTT